MKLTNKYIFLILFAIYISINFSHNKNIKNTNSFTKRKNVCSYGRAQSPINFSKSPKILKNSIVKINYDQIIGNLEWHKNSYRIKVNKNHNNPQYLTLTSPNGKFTNKYYLNKIKFKVKAEHQINNYHPKLEIQFVHTSNINDDSSYFFNFKRLTLSLLLDDDDKNPKGDDFLKNLNINGSNEITQIIEQIKSSGYFFYYGSLTEEPCTENNIWIVLTKKFTVGKDFLTGITKLTHEINNGKDNARGPNPINERIIYLYGNPPKQEGTVFTNQ